MNQLLLDYAQLLINFEVYLQLLVCFCNKDEKLYPSWENGGRIVMN